MRIILLFIASMLAFGELSSQNLVDDGKFNQESKNNKRITLSRNSENLNGAEVFVQKSRSREKSFGLGLSTNGVVGFTSRLNYAYINPVIDVVVKNKSNLLSVGLLVPVRPVNQYKYWVIINYLWGISEKKNKSWVYGVNVDFGRYRYRYHYITTPILVDSYYKKYSGEIVFQRAFLRKLSKNSYYYFSFGGGINLAFSNENVPPPTVNSGTTIKPFVKVRLGINTLLF